MSQIELYDTTLRDGMQGEGMSLSALEKLRVAHRLDEFGIDEMAAGFGHRWFLRGFRSKIVAATPDTPSVTAQEKAPRHLPRFAREE